MRCFEEISYFIRGNTQSTKPNSIREYSSRNKSLRSIEKVGSGKEIGPQTYACWWFIHITGEKITGSFSILMRTTTDGLIIWTWIQLTTHYLIVVNLIRRFIPTLTRTLTHWTMMFLKRLFINNKNGSSLSLSSPRGTTMANNKYDRITDDSCGL